VRVRLIAANWKMHKTAGEALAFWRAVRGRVPAGVEAVVCAPFTALSPLAAERRDEDGVALGAQNLFWEEAGAYTGEISPVMLADLGVRYVIVGHSERRQLFGETDETVNKKMRAALRHNLVPILCVGETLEEREAERTEDVVRRQTVAALDGVAAEEAARLVIAYEPVWAIGTGRTATGEDAARVARTIRDVLTERYGSEVAQRTRILYGGSVKPANLSQFLAFPEIDGALVGGASLEADSYLQLLEAARPASGEAQGRDGA